MCGILLWEQLSLKVWFDLIYFIIMFVGVGGTQGGIFTKFDVLITPNFLPK